MVPETAGKALENIDELFQHPWYMMRKQATVKIEDSADLEAKKVDRVSQVEYAKG